MPKQRTNFSGAEKIAILRKHLLPKVPITEVCEQHGLQPTIFYDWHKKLFKNGAILGTDTASLLLVAKQIVLTNACLATGEPMSTPVSSPQISKFPGGQPLL